MSAKTENKYLCRPYYLVCWSRSKGISDKTYNGQSLFYCEKEGLYNGKPCPHCMVLKWGRLKRLVPLSKVEAKKKHGAKVFRFRREN